MKMAKPMTREEAMLKMAGLCARSEQCAFDIARKLRAKGFPSDVTRSIIEELTERRFIDHRRFAVAFARDKVRFSAWGKMKIRAALMARRIPENLITEAFEEISPEDYEAAAMRSARSAAASLDLAEYADRVKLFRSMMSRGFEPDAVNKAIRKLRGG